MTTPAWMSRLRARHDDAQTIQLRALLAQERDRNRALEERLAELQAANEAHYRTQYEAAGGPSFDRRQPFPAQPGRPPASWGLKEDA
jgi:hypothetical protein